MLQDRNSLVLYTTAVCNLNCRYCFIDKNPALKQIDDFLDDSFLATPDYYFQFAKRMFLKDNLEEIQFWGGEPFLGMHRAYPTVEKLIGYYPRLERFMVSTNFVSSCFFDEFYGLINVLNQHPERHFEFSLQLSIDGPTNINDLNRGKGVTPKFIENFTIFIQGLQDIHKLGHNVDCNLHMKPTLDASSIEQLQTKEKVIEYFKFFEQFQEVFDKYNHRQNVRYCLPIPNTACPSPHTQEEGKQFANYCRLTRLIEEENKTQHHFKYYQTITSFLPRCQIPYEQRRLSGVCMGHCGNGKSTLGLLPQNKVSCCHNGFVDLISDYKKFVLSNDSEHMDDVTIEKGLFTNQRNSLIFDADSEEFEMYEKQLETFYDAKDPSKIANIASLIMLLAESEQIDTKYIDKTEALHAAYFLLMATSYCVRDNLGTTGSIYMFPLGLIKLLLNGAREYIEQGGCTIC